MKVSDFGASSLGDCWNAKLDLSASTLTCTAVDYNETLAAKSVTNFGFQAEFDSQDAANIDYSAILYIDGKEYTEKREEVTNMRNGLNYAKKVLVTGECDVLILDEVLALVDEGIIECEELYPILESRSDDTIIIMTGRVMPEKLKDYVDCVSNIEALC